MKLRRILAATAAAAITTVAMSVAASAAFITPYHPDDMLQFACFQSNDWHEPILADPADLTNVAGFSCTLTVDESQLEDYIWTKAEMADQWFGGEIGVNSNSTGWKVLATWGHEGDASAQVVWEATDTDGVYTCTYMADAPVFAADDEYAFFFFQDYSKPFSDFVWTISDLVIYAADGSVIETVNVGGDAAGSTDGATGDDKNSADTGVEGVAVAAGAVALAGAAMIVSRKRK